VFLESRSVERHSALDVGAKYEGFGRQCPKKLLPMMYHIGKFFAFAKFILKKINYICLHQYSILLLLKKNISAT
jgi:hypothetical protein